jgi:type VII secretion-associated serine protease mycosin
MRKRTLFFTVALCAGAFLLSQVEPTGEHPADLARPLPAAEERGAKTFAVEADVYLTGMLADDNAGLALRGLLEQLNPTDSNGRLKALQAFCASHSTTHRLSWYSLDRKAPELSTGASRRQLPMKVLQEMDMAKEKMNAGVEYLSPLIVSDQASYKVLAVLSPGKEQGLLGLYEQSLLSSVKAESRRSMKLVLNPNPVRKPGMKTADAGTLEETRVILPEDNEGKSHYYDKEVIVRFRKEPSATELAQIRTDIGAESVQKLGYAYVFKAKTMKTKQLMAYFRQHDVAYIEPHFLYTANDLSAISPPRNTIRMNADVAKPNDTLYGKYQWNLPVIRTESGWQLSKGSNDVIVAVVDTGVDLTHSDLTDRLIQGFNAIDNTKPAADDVGHGTHVAGIIAASVNNNLGIAGLTWNNPIMPVKVLDNSGAGNAYNVAKGIIWATDHGAKVINMSLGNYAQADFLHDAVKYAYDRDVVLVAASGNDNTSDPGYPAAYPEVVAVAATDSDFQKASFSNFGNYIDVSAPGVNIASTYKNNQYASLSGTSMASPHVAALAALIRSANPALTNKQVMDILRNTASDLGSAGQDPYYGFGEIDVTRALEATGVSASRTGEEQKIEDGGPRSPFSRLLHRLLGHS